MSGLKSRNKGKRGEREAAHALCEVGVVEAKRGCQYHGGPDSPDIHDNTDIHWEVKRCEKLSIYPALKQAEREAGQKIPAVLHRRNNEEWLVIVKLQHLKAIAREVLTKFDQDGGVP